jgi:uncharacterized DUF497 family protein
MLRFDWDERKNRANRTKHGIWFEEARSVFDDPRALLSSDPDHSEEEERFILLRASSAGRTFVVVHCHKESEELFRIYLGKKGEQERGEIL